MKFLNIWPFLPLNKVRRIYLIVTEHEQLYNYLSLKCTGNVKEALQLTNELLRIVPYHQRAIGNKKHYEDVLRKQGVIPEHGETEE